MINEKTYLKLMQRLPMTKCPDNIILEVLRVCNYPVKSNKKNFMPLLREITYGTGCLIILVAIFLMFQWSYEMEPAYHKRIEVNSHLLVRQLTDGAAIIFTEKIK
jgi:hypothetical protein